MKFEIDIPKRLHDDIKLWCETNKIDMDKYVEDKLRNAITLDKYGDLNEKLSKKKESKKEKKFVKITETSKIEQEIVPEIPKPIIEEKTQETTIPSQTAVETETETPIEKKHRSLKTK